VNTVMILRVPSEIPWAAEWLPASQEGLSSVELGNLFRLW
jgi:hypothetical protein